MEERLYETKVRAASAARTLAAATARRLADRQASVRALAGRLQALSPLSTLARGYAVPRDANGRTLTSARDFSVGAPFRLRLHDGEVEATTNLVRRDGEEERP